ncbi:MAG TPA: hypothetical protein VK138_06325 [Acidiferrobacterales bacterium]|nr:hypothetical protein [Acidiferrobacterales bacterium]
MAKKRGEVTKKNIGNRNGTNIGYEAELWQIADPMASTERDNPSTASTNTSSSTPSVRRASAGSMRQRFAVLRQNYSAGDQDLRQRDATKQGK